MPKESRRSRPERAERYDPHWQALGRAIKTLRTERGIERAELAEAAGLSYPYVAEIENGKKRPSSSALMAIAEALEMKPHELMASTEWRMGPTAESVRLLRSDSRLERGSWFTSDEDVSPMAMSSDERGPSDARAELIRAIETLDDEDVARILDFVRRLGRR